MATMRPGLADRELDQELQSHLQLHIDEHVRRGTPPVEARRLALIEAGGLEWAKEAVRDRRGVRWIEQLMRDGQYGLRFLRRSPGFTVAAVLSLALGIGANTAIFSIIDRLMLKPLPISDPQRLAQIFATGDRVNFTNPIWEQYRARPELAESLAAYASADFNMADRGRTDLVKGMWVSGRFFDVFGVRPLLGRSLRPSDDQRGGGADGPVAVISEQFWRARLNADPAILGRRLSVEHVTFTVVGVTPAPFFGPSVGTRFDVLVPLATEALIRGKQSALDRRSSWWLRVVARLRPDQSVEQLSAAVAAAQPEIRLATLPGDWSVKELPKYLEQPAHAVGAARGGQSYFRSQYRDALMAVMVVVAFVLLIACVNIANLLLARADARAHELSVRLALGASRARLVRQLLVESSLLSLAGGGLALLFAGWSSRVLVAQLSTWGDPIDIDLTLDWRVLGFTAAVAAGMTLLFGLAPALRATRVEAADALRERGRSARGHARWGVASALLVMQVALCLALVVAAGLFARTFTSLAGRPLGFDASHLLTVTLSMPPSDQRDNAARLDRYQRARDAIVSVPGVRQAALSVLTPFSNFQWQSVIDKNDAPSLSEERREYWVNAVGPGWFETVGTARHAGQDVSAATTAKGPADVVVNDAFVRQLLPGRNPIGQLLHDAGDPGTPGDARTIVGVVGDALYDSIRDEAPATMYLPIEKMGLPATEIVLNIRMADDPPASVATDLATAISAATPELSFSFRPMVEQVSARLVRERTVALLSTFFGALALLLAGLGLFGVVSYSVGRRRTEIGIRLALGARPSSVVRLIGTRVAVLVGGGLVAGLALSWWAAKFAGALLFGLTPTDPATFVGAACVLGLVGLAAAAIPAIRASRTDAASVLREG